MSRCFHLATHSPRTHTHILNENPVFWFTLQHVRIFLIIFFQIFFPFHQNIRNEKKPALRFNVWHTLFKLIKSNLIDGIVYIFVEYMLNVTSLVSISIILFFTHFLDLILIQCWKVNSIHFESLLSVNKHSISISKRSNFNWYYFFFKFCFSQQKTIVKWRNKFRM